MVNVSPFSQILDQLPRNLFQRLVHKHDSDKYSKGINSWTHFVSMIFCHLGHVGSLIDISNGLRSITGNINHLGCKRSPSKSSLSYINQERGGELFKEYYFELLNHFEHLFRRSRVKFLKLRRKVFLMDATIIPLCLSVFDWAKFRQRKGALKIHMVLDYDGCLPTFVDLTKGSTHEVTVARKIAFPKGSVLVFDRGYIDFEWLYKLTLNDVFFVTRAKDNMNYEVQSRNGIHPNDRYWLKRDWMISLEGFYTSSNYPIVLRLVKMIDPQTKQELSFLTNNLNWTAKTVCEIYKERWRIEAFFKHIKQHLKIKSFVGTSENAVQIQIWIALITMLILQVLQKVAKFNWNLSNLVAFIRLNLFVKIDLGEWLHNPFKQNNSPPTSTIATLF